MNDKSHPEYENLKKWAESKYYKNIFDIEQVNFNMKVILKWKKVKWVNIVRDNRYIWEY